MSEEEILHYAKIFSNAIGDVHKLEIYQGAEKKTIVEPELWGMVIDLLSKKDKEYTELYDEFIAEKQLSVKRLDISNRLREVIDKMAEDMATDYHSKEWVINYYMEKINESRGSN